uniref:hypothetical protein n=1 Tax=Thiolapillus sp. TaxID=2017437 RepID=UPI003AF7A3A3
VNEICMKYGIVGLMPLENGGNGKHENQRKGDIGFLRRENRDGNVHFGDRPPVEVSSTQLDVKVNTVSAPDNVKNSAREYASDLARRQPDIPPRKKKVVMYSVS